MLAIEKFDSSKKYPRHDKGHEAGGVLLKDEEGATVNTRAIILNLAKSAGSKLKEGKILDLLKISRPALISYPRTYLECMANDLKYTEFMDKAAETEDPIKRIKYVIAFIVSGLHCNSTEMGNNGPLNPVLGETYQAVKRDGTQLYCEQITHHPPVSAYLMTGPKNSYKLYGTGEITAKMAGINTITGQRIGETVIEFKNGDKVTVGNPDMKIDGLIMGARTINYAKTFTITDHTSKIAAEITFNYEGTGTITKLASGVKNFFRSSTKTSTKPLFDTFGISIFGFNEQKETNEILRTNITTGSGSWLSYLEVDGKILWKISDRVEDPWMEDDETKLQSDSKFRLDSKYIKEKDFVLAQKEKDALETLQRLDAKLRKGNKEQK